MTKNGGKTMVTSEENTGIYVREMKARHVSLQMVYVNGKSIILMAGRIELKRSRDAGGRGDGDEINEAAKHEENFQDF